MQQAWITQNIQWFYREIKQKTQMVLNEEEGTAFELRFWKIVMIFIVFLLIVLYYNCFLIL